jgi:hypothetical protein
MVFSKRLRKGVRSGQITCSVRIWLTPRVKVGGRYRMEEGEIEVDSIEPIGLPDITSALAQASGFLGVLDLLKVAKHGKGERIYLVRFTICRRVVGRAKLDRDNYWVSCSPAMTRRTRHGGHPGGYISRVATSLGLLHVGVAGAHVFVEAGLDEGEGFG